MAMRARSVVATVIFATLLVTGCDLSIPQLDGPSASDPASAPDTTPTPTPTPAAKPSPATPPADPTSPVPPSGQSNDRIAVSADGNIHDHDDWGATAATLAILHAAGVGDRLVHYDYSSHVGESTDRGERQMAESALGGADRYGYDTARFFDDTKDVDGAVASIKSAVDASTAEDRLTFIVAGPMEVAFRGIAAADENKSQFVTVVSHSGWNNTHRHGAELSHTADDVKRLGVRFTQLPDQNAHLHAGSDARGYERFEASDDVDITWIVERDDKRDISDAGMAYWAVTGEEKPTMDDLRTLLEKN